MDEKDTKYIEPEAIPSSEVELRSLVGGPVIGGSTM